MVHIIDDLYVKVDSNGGHNIFRKREKKEVLPENSNDESDESTEDKEVGFDNLSLHYSSLASAIQGIVRYRTRTKMAGKEIIELDMAVSIIQDSNAELINILKKFVTELDAEEIRKKEKQKKLNAEHKQDFAL